MLHEATNSTGRDIVQASLNRAITQLYDIQSTLSPILQSYFSMSLEDRLKRSPRQRKRWLRLAQLASSHASSAGTRQQLLSTYYPHAPSDHEVWRVEPTVPAAPPTAPTNFHQLPLADFFPPQGQEEPPN